MFQQIKSRISHSSKFSCVYPASQSVRSEAMHIYSWQVRLTIGFLYAGMLILSGCKKEAASTQAPPAPEVEVMTVSAQSVPDEPEFIGQAEASRVVEIRSQVTGIIKERFYEEGRDVKKGDRLYQIDPVPFRAAVLSAQAK